MLPAHALLLLLLPLHGEGGDVPAHVQSEYGQLVTSSTLTWVRSGAGHATPLDGVSSGTGQGVICRGLRQGVMVSGATSHGRCQVGMSGRMVSITSYEVLTQVLAASRVEWRTFHRFSTLPQGAVAGVDGAEPVFFGRRLERGMMKTVHLEMGKKGTGFGRIAVYSDVEEMRVENECDLLVEVEPVRYELSLHQFVKKVKKEEEKKVLASTSIFRFEEGADSIARMQKMIFYQYQKSLYLGHIRGTIRGLPGRVRLPSGENKVVVWGMMDTDKQRESIMVGYDMEKNTAVDVTINADSVMEEQPFSGLLVSIFHDGSHREREVEGVMQNQYLDKIQPEYSKLYEIKEKLIDDQTQNIKMIKTGVWQNSMASLSQEKLQQKKEDDREDQKLQAQDEKDASDVAFIDAVGISGGCGMVIRGACLLLTRITFIKMMV